MRFQNYKSNDHNNKIHYDLPGLVRNLLVLVPVVLPVLLDWLQPAAALKIGVCQNKNCRKRFRQPINLVQTLEDLFILPSSSDQQQAVEIESSGCLSQCGQGPNVVLRESDRGGDVFLCGLEDVASAASRIQAACGDSSSSLMPPTVLLAAVKVMQKAEQASSPREKLRFMDSVIKKLESAEIGFARTPANVHAHCLRGQAYLDLAEYQLALRDADTAIALVLGNAAATGIAQQDSTATMTMSSSIFPWRIMADAQEGLGMIPEAVETLRLMALRDPAYCVKTSKDIQRLLQNRATTA